MPARRRSPEPAKEPGTCCFSINPLPMHTALLELSSLEGIKFVLYLPAQELKAGPVLGHPRGREGALAAVLASPECWYPPALPLQPD